MAYNWIKMLMDIRNISIEEMAEATSLSTYTIQRYYNGSRTPGQKVKINLMRILDIPSEEEIAECCDLIGYHKLKSYD